MYIHLLAETAIKQMGVIHRDKKKGSTIVFGVSSSPGY